MNRHLYSYLDYTKEPWGKLFYEVIWHQLPDMSGKNILDFGSGFGITASHFSQNNNVTAVEPSQDMINFGSSAGFRQICGGIEKLKQMPEKSFDFIICHNVLEYADDRCDIIGAFCRLLKDDGKISIVKHNKNGRIMQKAIFDYDVESVVKMLNNENLSSRKFGEIKIYNDSDLLDFSDDKLKISACFGVCTFYGLQNNDIKFSDKWFSDMLNLEMRVSQIDDFRNIAFYHHILLEKNQ